MTPLVLIAMNVVYAASAYPYGRLADRMSHARLLAAGLVVLLWDSFGAAATFIGGGVLGTLALFAVVWREARAAV